MALVCAMLLCSCFYRKDLRLRQSMPAIDVPNNVGDDVCIDQAFEKLKSDLLCLNGSWFNRVEGLLRAFNNHGLVAELYGLASSNNFIALLSNTRSGADKKREILLQRMSSLKTPTVHLSPTSNCGGKQHVVAAALPLVHGGDLIGALWIGYASLQLPKVPPWRHATAPGSSSSNNTSLLHNQEQNLHPVTENGTMLLAAALLSSDESLRQLSFAASMCLASSGSDMLMWLTETVSRLQVAANMQALTAELCAAVASHVSNHFMLEVSINLALIPPRTSGSRLMTKTTTAADGDADTDANTDANAGADAPLAAATALLFRVQNNFDSGHVPATDTNCDVAAAFPPVGASACRPKPSSSNPHGSHFGKSPPNSPTVLGGTNAAPQIRASPGNNVMASSPYSTLRSSMPVGGTALSVASAACSNLRTSGGCGPALTTGSVVVSLSAAEAAAFTAAAPTAAALHADVLPLQHTLLQAVLDELQKQRQQGQQKEQEQSAGGDDVLPPGSSNGSTCSPISVIENTCLYIQNVHNPWRDVWLFMERGLECIATPTGVSSFGSSLTTTTASGSSSRSPMLQSLALLTMPLDEGSAALGLFLCFPKRLPGALLEAVQASCQELLSKGLSGQVRAKLEGTLCSEYDMLKVAAPGSYAVLRGVNTCEDRTLGTVPNYTSYQTKQIGFLDTLFRRKTVPSMTSQQSGSMLTTAFKTYALLGELDSGPSLTAVLSGVEDSDGNDKPYQSPAASNASAWRRSLAIRRTPSESAARSIVAPSLAPTSATFANTTHDFAGFPLASCNGDVPDTWGSCGASRRAAGALATNGEGGGAVAGGGNQSNLAYGPFASIVTIASVDTQAHQRMDLLTYSIQATVLASAASNSANCTFADDLEQLELTEVLGRGGGGVVLKGMMSGTLPVAVKLMIAPGEAVEELGLSPEAVRRGMLRNAMELAVQSSLSHPNIVQLYATFRNAVLRARQLDTEDSRLMYTNPRSLYLQDASMPPRPQQQHDRNVVHSLDETRVTCILAEYCDAGSLEKALVSQAFPRLLRDRMAGMQPAPATFKYDMKGVFMTLLDVALALRHLHSLHFVHRDVKPANLLLKSNPRDPRGFTVKLADFGFVLRLTETDEAGGRYANVDEPCGTVTHMAPECLSRKSKIFAAADIFSFGILMWELLAGGSRPFPMIHPDKISGAVYRGARPTFAQHVPQSYQSLAMLCWRTEPARRPSAKQLVTAITSRLVALS
ncbi:hypothetical protein VaNZ11_003324 [Volvox africanus]|uniref:Protein kinase domain-containing protein n=1 Tax=Volvox africanus TaxID=51714 RepID=A0ABQ5RUF3_9CHLO|nr:hypothetical protein VaNZ11_003324 [Volvox africanus]